MCLLCSQTMKPTRGLLAAKIIGHLPKEDDTCLEQTIEEVIKQHSQEVVGRINVEDGSRVYGCQELRQKLTDGIRKVLPTLSLEERFSLAVAAGAVKL